MTVTGRRPNVLVVLFDDVGFSDLGWSRVFARLQGPYAAMLDHADQQLAEVVASLEGTDQLDDTLVLVLSDDGASQEGRRAWSTPWVLQRAAHAPRGQARAARRRRRTGHPLEPPWGWAMAANTPFERCAATARTFVVTISWSSLDVGRDRASPVGDHEAPNASTGRIHRVVSDLDDDQDLDHQAVAEAESAREPRGVRTSGSGRPRPGRWSRAGRGWRPRRRG